MVKPNQTGFDGYCSLMGSRAGGKESADVYEDRGEDLSIV
jgi:hypothetical protein